MSNLNNVMSIVNSSLNTNKTKLNNLTTDLSNVITTKRSSIRATFEFYYHMFGDHVGVLKVYWQDGITPESGSLKELTITLDDDTTTTALSGEQHSSASDAWKRATAEITSTNRSGKVVFLYYKTSDGGNGSIALDRFNITGGITKDLGITRDLSTGVNNWLGQKIPTNGGDPFSVETAVNNWEAGNHIVDGGNSGDLVDLSTSNADETRTSYWILNNGPSSHSNTGPDNGASVGSNDYYIFAETENNEGPGVRGSTTMYYANNYMFLCSK